MIQTFTATVPLSGTVSDDISLVGATVVGLWCPTITSGTVLLQGSPDTTSANFVRITNAAGSGDWTWSVGPGSKAITIEDVARPFGYLRLETSVAQAAARTFQVVVKLPR